MTAKRVDIKDSRDVVTARQIGRQMALETGFGSADQTRLATAISELTRNVIQYAGTGLCTIADKSNESIIKIMAAVEDTGPGIPDIDQALEQGYSTGGGLGAGLPGTRRLVQEFDIDSAPGYTIVTIAMIRQRI